MENKKQTVAEKFAKVAEVLTTVGAEQELIDWLEGNGGS